MNYELIYELDDSEILLSILFRLLLESYILECKLHRER